MLRRRSWRATSLGGFDVGFEDHLVHVLGAAVAAGVDVDGDEGLGFIDDDVAAAGEPDLARECFVDLLLDVDALEDRLGAGGHVVHAAFGAARDLAGDLADHFGGLGVVAEDLVDFIGEEIAGGALDEAGFLEDAGGSGVAGAAGFDLVPLFEQHGEVADEVAGAGAGATVRMMMPMPSGTESFWTILRRRARSLGSSILREMPNCSV